MNNNPVILRMNILIAQIETADTAYYRDDNPIMTDREYDLLVDELRELENSSGIILSGSPTQKVPGEILESLQSVKHTKPMRSAQKINDLDEMIQFPKGRAVLLCWKMDGLTLVLRYSGGKLVQAITRGVEGLVGEDVTHTVKTFLNVPLTIPILDDFEVRGEGVISWANFDRINMDLEDPYTHPRNLAAGSTRKLDANEARKRYLEFHAFELVSDHLESNSKRAQQELLKKCGFSVVEYVYLEPGLSPDIIREAIMSFKPTTFPYPVDGLIMEYDDIQYGKSLGSTGHHDNRMAAYKWPNKLYETQFIKLDVAVTRTGMVSLTGIFKPVIIEGSSVQRAYLHNLDIFESMELGEGDTIQVYKANQIIPQIAENKTKSGTLKLPTHCPCCGEPLVIQTTSGGTRQLYCENQSCSAKLVRKFTHFCDKTRMNIPGISEKTLSQMVSHGWIKTFGDLYDLEQYHEKIILTDGFGEKSFQRMKESIEASRHCALAQFIAGMGIPEVGRHAGRDLDRYFGGSWDAFEEAIQSGFDFTQLPGFGEVMHNNIYTWYADTEAAKLWRPLLKKVEFKKENNTMETNTTNPFNGKTVVATGKLIGYTRDDIQMKLLSLGAKPTGSVTKKTDYLIVGENAGNKLKKAKDLGIKILTEEEFEAMLVG